MSVECPRCSWIFRLQENRVAEKPTTANERCGPVVVGTDSAHDVYSAFLEAEAAAVVAAASSSSKKHGERDTLTHRSSSSSS